METEVKETCECGCVVLKKNIQAHLATKKHQKTLAMKKDGTLVSPRLDEVSSSQYNIPKLSEVKVKDEVRSKKEPKAPKSKKSAPTLVDLSAPATKQDLKEMFEALVMLLHGEDDDSDGEDDIDE